LVGELEYLKLTETTSTASDNGLQTFG